MANMATGAERSQRTKHQRRSRRQAPSVDLGAAPELNLQASTRDGAGLPELAQHLDAHGLASSVLNMQRVHGNAFVQRLMRGQTDEKPANLLSVNLRPSSVVISAPDARPIQRKCDTCEESGETCAECAAAENEDAGVETPTILRTPLGEAPDASAGAPHRDRTTAIVGPSFGGTINRQPTPAPAPAKDAASVIYYGEPLDLIQQGTKLVADGPAVNDLLKKIAARSGEKGMNAVVTSLEGWLSREETNFKRDAERAQHGSGDVSGAPTNDATQRREQLPRIPEVVAVFRTEAASLRTTFDKYRHEYEEELLRTVKEMLDTSEKQIDEQAKRYGIALDARGNKGHQQQFVSLPGDTERAGLKTAARELQLLIRKDKSDEATAQALLTPPVGMIELRVAQAKKRKEILSKHPVLYAYVKDPDKLADLVSADDPYASAEKELNSKLDSIAVVRGQMKDNKERLKLDPRLRTAAKHQMLVPKNSWQDRVIDDEVAGIAADKEFEDQVKTAIGVGLMLVALAPGGQAVAFAGGIIMGGADILSKWEEFLWEDAASGSAFDKAMAISQSDPSLWRLAVEIAVDLGSGVVEGAAIGFAVETFKGMAVLVRESLAARAAAKAAGKAGQAAAAEAMALLRESGNGRGNKLGDRLASAINAGEFAAAEGTMAEAMSADGKPLPKGMVIKQEGGFADAVVSGTKHEIKLLKDGRIIRCSVAELCQQFATSVLNRLDAFGLENLTEAQQVKARELVARARALEAEGKALAVETTAPGQEVDAKLVEQKGTELFDKIKAAEEAVISTEQEFGMNLQKKLGIQRNYVGELDSVHARLAALEDSYVGKTGSKEMSEQCNVLRDEESRIRRGLEEIQKKSETANTQREIQALKDQASDLLTETGLNELIKKTGALEREAFSQKQALAEGGELYGKTDNQIRDRLGKEIGANLGKSEPVSDMVAKRKDGSYLITESKGNDVKHAVEQMENTIRLLTKANPGANGRIDLRITLPSDALADLSQATGSSKTKGWKVLKANEADTFGTLQHEQNGRWVNTILKGAKGTIRVQTM